MINIDRHAAICGELTALYGRKNHDYGDSFHKSFQEYGLAMACIRLEDKLNRLKALARSGDRMVQDESVRDTLLDLANYAVMTIMEMEGTEDEDHSSAHVQRGPSADAGGRRPPAAGAPAEGPGGV